MKPVMENPPRRLWLEHDRHCNLACPSCRSGIDGRIPGQDERDVKVKEICRAFLTTATQLTLMSSGEPLISHSSLEILSWLPQYPHLDVELFTNGLLLPHKWKQLPTDRIRRLNFSVDAATAGTYECVRFPGKWNHVAQSLDFASELRRTGQLDRVQLNMVVQEANFREIPAFIRMTRDYGFDVAHMARILRVWHSPDLYGQMNICSCAHPEHGEFLDVMRCDELNDPIALYPTIHEFRHC